MKHRIIASCMLLFALVFGSVKTYAETPIDFNDRLVSITATLYEKGTAWGNKFKELSESKNYKELAPLRIDMQKFIDKKIAELRTTKGVGKGSQEFLKTMIEFLNFEKGFTQAFLPFEKLNSTTSDEELKKAMDKLTEASTQEEGALAKVTAAQQAYAEKNDFTIEEAAPPVKEAE